MEREWVMQWLRARECSVTLSALQVIALSATLDALRDLQREAAASASAGEPGPSALLALIPLRSRLAAVVAEIEQALDREVTP